MKKFDLELAKQGYYLITTCMNYKNGTFIRLHDDMPNYPIEVQFDLETGYGNYCSFFYNYDGESLHGAFDLCIQEDSDFDELNKKFIVRNGHEMNCQIQIKNIIAFLAIIFGESKVWHQEIMKIKPDYLIEKFQRYIESTRHESDWGLHPTLRREVFEIYCERHNLPYKHYMEIE